MFGPIDVPRLAPVILMFGPIDIPQLSHDIVGEGVKALKLEFRVILEFKTENS
ncbi:hypothetical protein WN55_01202 [Dufourea novaeangliae]|uniref:Uncharacterized protein n=1 Tax=Dufourea novaeangliae TaxID=178035 RepID=A0A154PCW0_DUFNO|nr:hypothetical protein WN55_01202 [Dufourea novaeangliae]